VKTLCLKMPVDVLGGTAIKPVERHGMEAVMFFLYDKEKGAIMGRTPKSWGLITAFYIVYYTCLAAFWALMLIIFFQTIDDKVPRWVASDSLIGTSPAMGVRPEQAYERIDSSIIYFHSANRDDKENKPGWFPWANRTNNFLDTYRNVTGAGIDCNGDTQLKFDEYCLFNVDRELGACAKEHAGYDKAMPCIFLKLNKIFNLIHSYHTNSSALPDYVPARVKTQMDKFTGKDKNQVWVHCHGENPADVEAMGDIKYFPESASFHGKYFPYLNQPGYQSPLIAVQFANPEAGQLIHIECRAYAQNIDYNKRDKIGRAHFEILIHNPKQ